MDDQDKSKPDMSDVKGPDVYRWLTTYYLHQDRLSWSRMQTIVAVEAGILAAAFHMDVMASIVPLVIGTVVIILIWRLILRDWEVRDQDLNVLDLVHKPRGIKVTCTPNRRITKGKTVLPLLMWTLVSLNVVLAMLFLHFGSAKFLAW